jgi:heptosyltransferase-3
MKLLPPDAVPPAAVRRVLVIKLRNHGDVLLSSPVFTVLKQNCPHAEIDALVYEDTAPMLEGHTHIARLFTVRRSSLSGALRGILAEIGLMWELRRRGYDLIVHLTNHNRGARICRLIRPKYSVNHAVDSGKFFRRNFTHLVPSPKGGHPRHAVEVHLDALRRIGMHPESDDAKRLVLVPGDAAATRADSLLAEHRLERGKFVLVHPGSRWSFKCWPADRVKELIARLVAEGGRVVVTGSPEPKEFELVREALRDAPAGVVDLSAKLSLRELAALIARAGVFFGVDSVPMHIAAAVGTPAVAIFGPSSDAVWSPWMAEHTVLRAPGFACAPCNLDGCGGSKRSACVESVSVDSAHAAIRKLFPRP